MGEAVIGPDTSEGLSPDPTVLLFYACFFFFGTHVRQRGIAISKSCAYLTLPALTVVFGTALLVLYPDGKPVEPGGPAWAIGAACQAAFAWLMCFGTMGLFRLIASKERLWVRYVADSSCWLYLWHLPLLIALQYPLSRMDIDPHLNFLILCLLATAILLATYQFVVRYTLIGTLLNGKRTRRRSPANAGPIAAGSIRT